MRIYAAPSATMAPLSESNPSTPVGNRPTASAITAAMAREVKNAAENTFFTDMISFLPQYWEPSVTRPVPTPLMRHCSKNWIWLARLTPLMATSE